MGGKKTKHSARLQLWLLILFVTVLVTALIIMLRTSTVYFLTPDQLLDKTADQSLKHFVRLGGKVRAGSLRFDLGSKTWFFVLAGKDRSLDVVYHGSIPELFRENQNIVIEGKLQSDGQFRAAAVLVRHNEVYMSPATAVQLEQRHHWNSSW